MEMMLTMLEYGAAKEGDGDYQSPLDLLFEALEEENPNHIARRQYKVFKQAPSETAMSILITASVRLAPFTLPEVQRITSRDTMELGERKQAVFCIIPDSNDASLNFLVGMLYTQAFQELYYQADKVHGAACPFRSGSCSTSSPMSPSRTAMPGSRPLCAPGTSWQPSSCKISRS